MLIDENNTQSYRNVIGDLFMHCTVTYKLHFHIVVREILLTTVLINCKMIQSHNPYTGVALHMSIFTLRDGCSAVYCNRSCLFVGGCGWGC